MTTHRVRDDCCPFCKTELDCASGGPERPKPGDLSVCLRCANPLIFGDDLSLLPLTLAEIADLEPEVRKMLLKNVAAILLFADRNKDGT